MTVTASQRIQIAELVKSARKRNNITMEVFGKKIFGNTQYYSKQAIHHWEKGQTIPSMAILHVMRKNKEKWIRDLADEIITIIEGSEVQPEKEIQITHNVN